MTVSEREQLLGTFHCNVSASEDVLAATERELRVQLPADYVEFLRRSDGGVGEIGGGVYASLWRAEELAKMNAAYEVDRYAPGLLLLGSDGGGEAIAYDLRSEPPRVVAVPFVGMSVDLVENLSPSFDDFLRLAAQRDSLLCPRETTESKGSHEAAAVGRKSESLVDREIFEIHPIILGGSPTDPRNKAVLTRPKHIEAVRYWNRVVRDVRMGMKNPRGLR